MQSVKALSSLIWSSADEILRGLFKPSEYGRVILPFAVMRRLDCVLEPHKDNISELYEKYKNQLDDPSPVIMRQIGIPFFNYSKFDLLRLKSDPNNILINFNNYLNCYSKNVLEIFENFQTTPLTEKLQKNDRLYLLIDKFTEFDLHPSVIDNHQMGSVYEELLRKFSEMSNEESGDHFTPRDVVKLLVNFVFATDKEDLTGEGKIRSIFDPCCGTGGMLTIGKEWIHKEINPNLKIDLYGQELNDVTYAICKSDFLILGENPANIVGPLSSISKDKFKGKKFDYLITNPPFGVSWKSEQKFVIDESKDPNGRFVGGIPTVKDGSMIFLQHLVEKMKPEGSRVGIVFSGSPMFTGESSSGESNIRKYLIQKDLIESITVLPNRMFFNTDFTTYIWIISNKKIKQLQNKILFFDMSSFGTEMKRNLGKKGQFISEKTIKLFTDLYLDIGKQSPYKKIFNSDKFGYQSIVIDFPLVEDGQIKKNKNGRIIFDSSKRKEDRVPLQEDLEQYFQRELKESYPGGMINLDKTSIGYEINPNKFFGIDKKTRIVSKIIKDISEVDQNLEKQYKKLINYTAFNDIYSEKDLKETSFDWLGKVPSRWDVSKISALYEEVSIKNYPNEEPLSVFREYGVIRRFERENKNVLSDDLSGYKLVEKNDLVLNKMKCWSGSLGVSEYRGIVSPSYIVLKPKKDIFPKYIHYLLRSQRYINQYNKLSYGVRPGQWDLRLVDFKNLPIVIPSFSEQKQIAILLEEKSKLSITIEELTEQKNKLLYELRIAQVDNYSMGVQ